MTKASFIADYKEFARNGEKLQLVKLVKEAGKRRYIGLKDAKDFVDDHYSPLCAEEAYKFIRMTEEEFLKSKEDNSNE